MKTLFFIPFLFFCFFAKAQNSEPLFVIMKKGKFGFIDKTGKIVIDPNSSKVENFSDGYAKITYDNGVNFFNSNGGYALKDTKYAFLDTKTFVPKYEDAGKFVDGVTWVRKGKKYGLVDKNGDLITKLEFDYIDDFSEGLAVAMFLGSLRYIDKTGKYVMAPDGCAMFLSFSEGLATAKCGGKAGCIDKTGKTVIKPEYDMVGSFSEEMAWVKTDNKFGFIDKNGNVIVNLQYKEAQNFSEGLALVSNGKIGFIDKTGNAVIPLQYDAGTSFSEGLASVAINKKFGYMDKTGKIIIEPSFDEAYPFNNGLALVKVGEKIGYIDKTGKYIWKPTK